MHRADAAGIAPAVGRLANAGAPCRSCRPRDTRSRSRQCRHTSCSCSLPPVETSIRRCPFPSGASPRCRRRPRRPCRRCSAAARCPPCPRRGAPVAAGARVATRARAALAAGARQRRGVTGAVRVLAAAACSDERHQRREVAIGAAPSGPSRRTARVRATHERYGARVIDTSSTKRSGHSPVGDKTVEAFLLHVDARGRHPAPGRRVGGREGDRAAQRVPAVAADLGRGGDRLPGNCPMTPRAGVRRLQDQIVGGTSRCAGR